MGLILGFLLRRMTRPSVFGNMVYLSRSNISQILRCIRCHTYALHPMENRCLCKAWTIVFLYMRLIKKKYISIGRKHFVAILIQDMHVKWIRLQTTAMFCLVMVKAGAIFGIGKQRELYEQ